MMGDLSTVVLTPLYYIYLLLCYLLYCLLYPLLVVLAPVIHLSRFALYAVLVPFRLLVKFETLYIFIGVAAAVGIIAGALLHFSSTTVISALNLQSTLEDDGEGEYVKPASVLGLRREQPQQRVKSSAVARSSGALRHEGANLEKAYAEMDRGTGRTRGGGGGGLLSQTILEEDDDSEEGF